MAKMFELKSVAERKSLETTGLALDCYCCHVAVVCKMKPAKGERIKLLKATTLILKINNFFPERVTKTWLFGYVFFLFSLNGITIGLYGHIWYVLENFGFVYEMIADDIAGIMSSHSVMYVFINFPFMITGIRKSLVEFGDFTEYEKPPDIEKVDRILDFLAKCFAGYIYLSIFILWTWQALAICDPEDQSNCGLLVNAYLPIDIFSPIPRKIMMSVQIYSGFVCCFGLYYLSWLVLSLGMYAVCYLKHLQNMLRMIPSIQDRKSRRLHFRKCIRYHQRILSITTELTELCQSAMLIHVTTAAAIISLISYQLIAMDFEYIAFVHLLAWFLGCLVSAIFGEELLQESTAVGFAAYDSIPYDDPEITRDLMLVIIRSRVPLCFKGSKFAIIGHVRFGAMMQTSYSFLTLLINSE